MSIIPQAALTTMQIVSGLAATAKNAYELTKATSNNELEGAVSELYDSVLDVKARVLDLDEENRSLKTQLARREEIEGPDKVNGYFYFKNKQDQPLCPKCYQSVSSNVVFLRPVEMVNQAKMRKCSNCDYKHWETKSQTLQPRMISHGPWS